MRFVVFILALVVRLAAIELTGAGTIEFGDGPDYVATARSLCTQHVYPERGNLPFFRAPGLPFFIAAVTACEPSRTRAIKYALGACDALTVLFIFLIAERLKTNRWIAAGLAAVHPFFVAAVTDIRGEPLFMMLLVAAMWLLLRGNPAWSGVALGLCALTRPTGLLCIPLFALFAFFVPSPRDERGEGQGEGPLLARGTSPHPALRVRPLPTAMRLQRGEGTLRATAVLLATALTLAPWTIRNFIRFHEFIPVTDAGGFNLWRGTHPELMKTVETTDPTTFAQRSLAFETRTVSAAAREVDARAKTPGARDREWRRLAMENVRRDPAFAARSTLKKLVMYWRPWLHPAEHGRAAIAVSLVVNLGLFILGAIGLWRYPDRRIAIAVVVFFVAMWLAHLPYIPTIRLRMPLTDPLLIVFASAAIVVPRKVLVFLPIIAVALAASQVARIPAAQHAIAMLQSASDAWWAIPLFVALYAVCAILLLPVGLLSAAAAVMWGWKLGGAIELATCTLAALPPFFIARRGLGEWIERRLSRERLPALDSPFVLFLLRVVPLVPYVALNYIAGATRIRMRDYVLTTLAGSIPSVFLFAYFVDTMAAGAMGLATQAKLLGVCMAVAIIAIIGRLAADRVARPS